MWYPISLAIYSFLTLQLWTIIDCLGFFLKGLPSLNSFYLLFLLFEFSFQLFFHLLKFVNAWARASLSSNVLGHWSESSLPNRSWKGAPNSRWAAVLWIIHILKLWAIWIHAPQRRVTSPLLTTFNIVVTVPWLRRAETMTYTPCRSRWLTI